MNGKVAKAIRKTVYRNTDCHQERQYKTQLFPRRMDTGKTDKEGKTIWETILLYTQRNKPLSRRSIVQNLKKEYRERRRNGEQKLLSKIQRNLKDLCRRDTPMEGCAA